MKRTLFAAAMLAAVAAFGIQKPARESLPSFDKRLDGQPAGKPSDAQQKAIATLQERVPNLTVTHDSLLSRPSFFSSRTSFLSGPDSEGLGIDPASARALPKTDQHRAVKAFLNEHAGLLGYGAGILDGAAVRRDYVAEHNQLRTVVWEQRQAGILVFDAVLMAHITRNGELVSIDTHFVPDTAGAAATGMKGRGVAAAPVLSAAQAVAIAAGSLGDKLDTASVSVSGPAEGASLKQTLRAAPILKGDQYAELVWLPLNGSAMRLCWQVIVISKALGEGYLLVVDAETGEVLVRRGLTNYISDISLRVYTSDSPSPFSPGWPVPSTNQPPLVPRVLVVTNALNTNASPNGWIDDNVNETLGNNVDAHTDRNDDDLPDLPRPQGSPNRVFDFALDLTQDPTNYSPAAVVQLFYWNNFMHDKLYELGFTEATGNFQTTNFGRGGFEGDAVSADAQDGGGFDNANMATLPDGIPPRMQMYIFSGPRPMRDGDLDAEVVCHEYTHGLSNRRVGGGVGISQLAPSGMGEGWSDFYSLSLLSEPGDDIAGNYAEGGYVTFLISGFPMLQNYYYGIRRYPYSTNLLKNPLTFKDIDPGQASPHIGIPRSPLFPFTPFDADEVHNAGEVWCVTLWEMRANLIGKYGYTVGNRLALQLVTDAMSLCPVNPNFLQSRDAIVQADSIDTGGANFIEIWTAFAKRGMGGSATAPASSTTRGVVEAYDLPGIAFSSATVDDSAIGNKNGAIDYNECFDLRVALHNGSVGVANGVVAQLLTTAPGVTIAQDTASYPTIPVGGTAQGLTPFRVSTSPNFVCGSVIQFTIIIRSSSATTTNKFFVDSGYVSTPPIVANNSLPLDIPDANTNGVFSTINVSGVDAAIGKVTVSLHITHSFDFDLTVQLIGPDGTTVTLIRNEGGPGSNFGTSCSLSARTTLDDNATLPISLGNAPFVGTFRPEVPLQVFRGKSGAAVNGAWRLKIVDGFAQDVGTLQCWSLALYPTVCTDGGGVCGSDIAVSALVAPNPGVVGADLTYTVGVANLRPNAAAGVVLSNVVPAGATFVSATSSQGSCAFTGGVVRCNIGTLVNTLNAIVTIILRPTGVGDLTNVFSVSTTGLDVNTANNSVQLVTPVVQPGPLIVAGGAVLVSESYSPATGGIEAGETVKVGLALRNDGSLAATNLMATLLPGNGVSTPSPAQIYGTIPPGATVARDFTFTASSAAGSSILAVLQLQDGLQSLPSVSYTFGVGSGGSFANTAPIVINEFGAASPYPSTINISGLAGIISRLTVTLSKVSHAYPDDLDVLLVGPSGQKILLMSDAGGSNSLASKTLTFDAAAASKLPDEGAIASGAYLPTDYEPGDTFFASAPAGPYGTSFNPFLATDPNGIWSLYIMDDSAVDSGQVSGGWSLDISTAVPVNLIANLALAISSPSTIIQGELFSYTINVTNLGPNAATNIVVSNSVTGLVIDSVTANGGTASVVGGAVIGSIPGLSSGGRASVIVTAHAGAAGSASVAASVTSAATDPDLSNNSALVALTVAAASANLSLAVTSAPAPAFVSSNVAFFVTVSNRGPNRALSVQVTNTLPAGWTFVSATNSQGTSTTNGSLVVCDFGAVATNQSVSAVIHANAGVVGLVTNSFGVTSTTPDPDASNNRVQVVTTVSAPAPVIVAVGAAIVSEAVPADGVISPGEIITLNLALRNAGTRDATNLVATLQNSGGIVPISPPVSYGSLIVNGPVVSRPVSFTASAGASGSLVLTLQLQDNSQNLGVVTFTLPLAATASVSNNNVIIIPDHGPATNYPSTIAVAGLSGTVSKVTVAINQLRHSYPQDIDMLLVGPGGQKVLLMSDAGSGNSISGVNLTFDDGAAAGLPLTSTISSGTYRPTDYAPFSPADNLLAPAPAGPYGTSLAVFNGTSPNGAWALYVFDASVGDAGRIDGGWALTIQTAAAVTSGADVSVTMSAAASAQPGSTLTYTISVANNGPATATSVIVNDTLPTGFTVTGAVSSQGVVTTSGNSITGALGTLNSGSTATISLVCVVAGAGSVTNSAVITAAETDPLSSNNKAVVVTQLFSPSLSIRLEGSNVIISWPASAVGYILEKTASFDAAWVPASLSITVINGQNVVTVPAVGSTFYRLRKP